MRNKAKNFFQRYFIDAMSSMALGLFSSLIIGLILSQLSQITFLSFLQPMAAMSPTMAPLPLLGLLLLMHVLLPAALTLCFWWGFKKIGWIKPGDMKLAL